MLLLGACENDLNKIQEISSKYANQPVDTTKGVDVIYSDSAIVKGRLTAPVMVRFNISDPISLMPKGVKVVFYGYDAQESGNIIADSGVYHSVDQKVEFYHHVVYTTKKGDTFKSDQLMYDPTKKIIYSDKPVQIIMANGDILNGINFTSDSELKYPVMNSGTGAFDVTDMPGK